MSTRMLRWTVYVLIAIGFAVACAFLSHWQFDRSEEKNATIARVEANYDATPVALDEVLGDDDSFDAVADEWMQIELTGEYIGEGTVVRNRVHAGTSAYESLVPFVTDDGRVLIVDRGWVMAASGDEPEAIASPPSGEVTIVVRARPGENLPSSGRSAPPGQVPTIHLPTVAAELDEPEAITTMYGQLVSENPSPEVSLGSFDKPEEDAGMNLSYAIQWILFAVMAFVFLGYIIRTEIVKHREELEGAPPREKKPRRRDRDAADEDELLDAR
ncbi:SURF1 family protein [Microbacterium sp. ZW T5_45]|uniref:SURF1 family cytochrome oxidase biogenesis protein n=1 Tax=Microbacterium sp. ZW T5_45 TaxID=3378080 RepID=UPI0038521EA6